MALPATDSFTDANGTELSEHSSDWTCISADAVHNLCEIQSNQLTVDTGANYGELALYAWNADAPNADQYSKAKYSVDVGAYCDPCVAVRCSLVAMTGYTLEFASDGAWTKKWVAGSDTALESYDAPSLNDIVEIRASGETVSYYKNSGLVGDHSDSGIASGALGVGASYWGGQETRLDDWEGGNLAGGTPIAAIAMSSFRHRRV